MCFLDYLELIIKNVSLAILRDLLSNDVKRDLII